MLDYGPAAFTQRVLDLSKNAFAVLASPDEGVIDVTWSVVR